MPGPAPCIREAGTGSHCLCLCGGWGRAWTQEAGLFHFPWAYGLNLALCPPRPRTQFHSPPQLPLPVSIWTEQVKEPDQRNEFQGVENIYFVRCALAPEAF